MSDADENGKGADEHRIYILDSSRSTVASHGDHVGVESHHGNAKSLCLLSVSQFLSPQMSTGLDTRRRGQLAVNVCLLITSVVF